MNIIDFVYTGCFGVGLAAVILLLGHLLNKSFQKAIDADKEKLRLMDLKIAKLKKETGLKNNE